jgi:transcriptional regulator with XRE-family HTH domain
MRKHREHPCPAGRLRRALDARQTRALCTAFASGVSRKDLAQRFGVSAHTVAQILHARSVDSAQRESAEVLQTRSEGPCS